MGVVVGGLGVGGEVGCDRSIPSQPRSQPMPQLIPPPQIASLLTAFAPCFTAPSLSYFIDFVTAMIVIPDRLTTTTVCRSRGLRKHWTNYSRFLSRYRWRAEDIAQRLLDLLLSQLPLLRDDQGRRRLCLVIDETIVEKTSRRRYGVAWQRNTHGGWCRGTHILGHYWLCIGVLFSVAGRVLCFPIAFGLYRQRKRCPEREYASPCEIARMLVQSLRLPQTPNLVPTLIVDAGFADHKLLRWCTAHGLQVITRGRLDADICDLYVHQPRPLRGRPRKYGAKLSLKPLAQDPGSFRQSITLYQNQTGAQLASVEALHRVSGLPMRFVIVRCQGRPDGVVMSSDLSLTPRETASLYAARFTIEIMFRELKQHFGMGHYQVRLPQAILKHVHLSGVACALTQLLALAPPQSLRDGLLHPQTMPWRRPVPYLSVRQTQTLLRQLCTIHWAFSMVAQLGLDLNKSRLKPALRALGAGMC